MRTLCIEAFHLVGQEVFLKRICLLLRPSIMYAPSDLLEFVYRRVEEVVLVSQDSFRPPRQDVPHGCWNARRLLEWHPSTPIRMQLKDLLQVCLGLLTCFCHRKSTDSTRLIIDWDSC